jgi:putative membrane protein
MTRIATLGAFVLMALFSITPAFAQMSDREYWGPGWGYGHMMFGGLTMIIFWGGIILLVILLIRWLGPGHGGGIPHARHQTPLEILQERFARGEIDKAEYEERRKTLQQ